MPLQRNLGSFSKAYLPRRRWLRLLGGLGSLGFGALILACGLLYARLAAGPINLDSLAPRLEAAMADRLGGLSASFGALELALGSANAPLPGLYLRDVALRDADGATLAAAPEVRLGFDPMALLGGSLALRTVDVSEAEIVVARDALGRLHGEIAGAAPTGGIDLFAAFAPDAPPLLRGLGRLAFHDAVLVVRSRQAGTLQRIAGAEIVLRRRGDRIDARAQLPGWRPGAEVVVEAHVDRDGWLVAEAGLVGMDLADLAAWDMALAPLAGHRAPIEGTLDLTLAPDGAIAALALRTEIGRGVLALGGAALALNGASLAAWLDPATGQLHLDRIALDTERGGLSARGVALREPGPGGSRVVLQLDLDTVRVAGASAGGVPVSLGGGGLLVAVDPASRTIEIADAWLARDGLRLDAGGTLALGADPPALALQLRAAGLDVEETLALWPATAAPRLRAWLAEALESGLITEAAMALRGPLTAPRWGLSLAFEDAVAHPLRPLPPVTGAAGWAEFDGTGFALTLERGGAVLPGYGRLDLAGSSVRVPRVAGEAVPAAITIEATGPLGAALAVIDGPPLGLLQRAGIAPALFEGDATIRVDLALPLLRVVPREAVSVAVKADLAAVVARLPALPAPARIDRMTLRADRDGLSARGDGSMAGFAGGFTLEERFAPAAGAPRSTVTAEAVLSAADVAALGLATDNGWFSLSGRVPLTLRLDRVDGAATAFSARLDLSATDLALPLLDWRKGAGAAAQALIEGRLPAGGGETVLDRVAVDAPGLTARGSARLGAGGAVESADLTALRIDDRADLAARLRRGDQGFALRLAGASLALDARALAQRAGAPAGQGPLTVEVDLAALTLAPGLRLSQARGSLDRDAGGALSLVLDGTLGTGATVAATLDIDANAHGRLRIDSSDAGEALRGAGVFRRGIGGGLSLSADFGDGLVSGEAVLTDFAVGSHPAIERALAEADLEQALLRLRDGGLQFREMRLPFRLSGNSLSLGEAVAHGPMIGLSLWGEYGLADDRLAMQGVFTPFYGLNSLVGAVPLIGPLLTGGAGQGVIAFTFDLDGSLADPQVSVNPFSALLPGVLRQIMQAPAR